MYLDPVLLASIHRIDKEVIHNKIALRQTQDEIQHRKEQLTTYKFLKEAEEQLRILRLQLDSDIQNNGDIVALMDQAAQIKQDLGEHKEILSNYLMRYYLDTESAQVPTSNNRAKKLILSAKLGKEQAYQERFEFNSKDKHEE